MFIRNLANLTLGGLAALGGVGIYRGAIEGPGWGIFIALVVGCAFGALMRDVPADILANRQKRGPRNS